MDRSPLQELPQLVKDMVGQEFKFAGHVLSNNREDDFTSKVLDVRWGRSMVRNINDKSAPARPTIEFLIRKPGHPAHWSKPFAYDSSKPDVYSPLQTVEPTNQ